MRNSNYRKAFNPNIAPAGHSDMGSGQMYEQKHNPQDYFGPRKELPPRKPPSNRQPYNQPQRTLGYEDEEENKFGASSNSKLNQRTIDYQPTKRSQPARNVQNNNR